MTNAQDDSAGDVLKRVGMSTYTREVSIRAIQSLNRARTLPAVEDLGLRRRLLLGFLRVGYGVPLVGHLRHPPLGARTSGVLDFGRLARHADVDGLPLQDEWH